MGPTVTVTDEKTTDFSLLLSGSTILMALMVFYVGRSLWIARNEWSECAADTKILYLLVAPPLTLAVDILEFTDRLFWRRPARQVALKRPRPPRPAQGHHLRAKPAMRSHG
jgi:hypothetical protein